LYNIYNKRKKDIILSDLLILLDQDIKRCEDVLKLNNYLEIVIAVEELMDKYTERIEGLGSDNNRIWNYSKKDLENIMEKLKLHRDNFIKDYNETKINNMNIKDDLLKINIKTIDIKNFENISYEYPNIDKDNYQVNLNTLKKINLTSDNINELLQGLEKTVIEKANKKDTIIDSYIIYNNALDMVKNNDITNAINELNKAIKLNPKDIDILNLLGICNFLQCNFDKALGHFAKSLNYKYSDVANKYIDSMNSIEFETFLERYNHAIRFIKEGFSLI